MKRRSHHKAAARASYALQREFKAANEAAGASSKEAIAFPRDFDFRSYLQNTKFQTSIDACGAEPDIAVIAMCAAEPIGGAISPQAFRLLMECQAWQPQTLDLDAMCALARAAVRSTVERRACAHEVAILKASDAEIDRTHAIYRAYRRDVDAIFRRLSDA